MNCYFSRIRVTAADPDKIMAILKADGYRLHQMLWDLFPSDPTARRDFLFRRDETNGWPVFYLLSSRQPVNDQGILEIESKPFNPQLQAGDRLGFSLRANPVRTRKTEDPNPNKRRRDDVVWCLKAEYRERGETVPEQAELAQQAGKAWIMRQGKRHGFEIHSVRVDGYQQHRVARASRNIRFSTLDFNGVLTVTKVDDLIRALTEGIGPAKAFGCGLMMVKRV